MSSWDYVIGTKEIEKEKNRWCPPNFMREAERDKLDEEEEEE